MAFVAAWIAMPEALLHGAELGALSSVLAPRLTERPRSLRLRSARLSPPDGVR
jgi:hypothetical protein